MYVCSIELLDRFALLIPVPGFEDAKKILEDLEQAEAAASGSYATPKGVLSVTAPVLFGQKHIAPILTEYLEQNPAVEVRAIFYDRVGNILDEGLDVAIRIGHLKDSSLYATKVGSTQRIVCGSPGYFDKHGVPEHPEDLANHEIILASTVEPSTTWRFESPTGKISVKVSPVFIAAKTAPPLKRPGKALVLHV